MTITGKVFHDTTGRPGLVGWVVELTEASGLVNTTTLTDAFGNYSFVGLPAGTYAICEQIQAGWFQTAPRSGPACPTGLGYSFTLTVGGASFVNFGNIR